MDNLRSSTIFTVNKISKLLNIAEKAYRAKRRLYREIKIFSPKFFVFFVRLDISRTTHVYLKLLIYFSFILSISILAIPAPVCKYFPSLKLII